MPKRIDTDEAGNVARGADAETGDAIGGAEDDTGEPTTGQSRVVLIAWVLVVLSAVGATVVLFVLATQGAPDPTTRTFEARIDALIAADQLAISEALGERADRDPDAAFLKLLVDRVPHADAASSELDTVLAFLQRSRDPRYARMAAWHFLDAIEADLFARADADANPATGSGGTAGNWEDTAGNFELERTLEIWFEAAPSDPELAWIRLLYEAARGNLLDGYAGALVPLIQPESGTMPEIARHSFELRQAYRAALADADLTERIFAGRIWSLSCVPRYAPALHELLFQQLEALVWEEWWTRGPEAAQTLANVPVLIGASWQAAAADSHEFARALSVEAAGQMWRQELKLLAGRRTECAEIVKQRMRLFNTLRDCERFWKEAEPYAALRKRLKATAPTMSDEQFRREVDEALGSAYRAEFSRERGELDVMADWVADHAAATDTVPNTLPRGYQVMADTTLYPARIADLDEAAITNSINAWVSLLDGNWTSMFPDIPTALRETPFDIARAAAFALLRLGAQMDFDRNENARGLRRHPNVLALALIASARRVPDEIAMRITLADQPGLWAALVTATGARLAGVAEQVLSIWTGADALSSRWPLGGREITFVHELRRLTDSRGGADPELWRTVLRVWTPRTSASPPTDRHPAVHE